MMTLPPEMIDFIHNANTTCTACVQQAKPDDRPGVWSPGALGRDAVPTGKFRRTPICWGYPEAWSRPGAKMRR
jgi:hypothetical protein